MRSALSLVASLLGAAVLGMDFRADGPAEPPLTAADRTHWSFRPPVRPALPSPRNAEWVRTPIDAFILARLEKSGLAPAPATDKATLLRRVTLDLTGLP